MLSNYCVFEVNLRAFKLDQPDASHWASNMVHRDMQAIDSGKAGNAHSIHARSCCAILGSSIPRVLTAILKRKGQSFRAEIFSGSPRVLAALPRFTHKAIESNQLLHFPS